VSEEFDQLDVDATLREVVERLAPLDRTPCSPGEREAAEWLAERMRAVEGVEVAVEDEPSWGIFAPTSTGLGALGVVGAALVMAAGRRPRLRRLTPGASPAGGWGASRPASWLRRKGALMAAVTMAGIVDEAQNGPRIVRRLVRSRKQTVNVIATVQPADASSVEESSVHTLVVLAHHDAPQSGLIFDQTIQQALHKRVPKLTAGTKTPPPQWWIGLTGPLFTIAAAALARPRLARRGAAIGVVGTAFVVDIWRRATVQGANDNLSGVASLVALAEMLSAEPLEGVRVMLVSCGAEETLQDGIRAFMARHGGELPKERTCFVNLDTVGSPHLAMLEAEGPVWMETYPGVWLRDLLAASAERLGVGLERGFRARSSTDSVIPGRGGYPIATLVSITDWRTPANYHLPSDVPENLNYATVADATRVVYEVARQLALGNRGAAAVAGQPST